MKKNQRYFLLFILICFSFSSLKDSKIKLQADNEFIGDSGIFLLAKADHPLKSTDYNHSYIKGGAIRTKWNSVEPFPGKYDFSFLDNEINTAINANKKIGVQIFGYPNWLICRGANFYQYIDENKYHSTFGFLMTKPLNYDSLIINRYKLLMNELAKNYKNNPHISYFHIYSDISNDLPTHVANGTPFHESVNYNPEDLISKWKDLTDHYMSLFPTTPIWHSVDHIRFEEDASGNLKNYVAKQFTNWGRKKYPKRFGVWREDLSGCILVTIDNPKSHWSIIADNSFRTGAQMVWNVQDGPGRMNNCNFTLRDYSAKSKSEALDSAVRGGLNIGIRYFEIYKADILDPDLQTTLNQLGLEISKKYNN